MRTIIISTFLALSLLFFSCKKNDRSSDQDTTLYEVSFNLTGFSQVITDFKNQPFSSSETPSLSGSIRYLYYFIYNADGAYVNFLKQTDTDENFGKIVDKVAAGSYTVVLFGSKNEEVTNNPTTLDKAKLTSSSTDDDVFFKKLSVVVGSNDVSQDLSLEHIASYLELNIEEVLPANVASVEMLTPDELPVFSFSAGMVTTSNGTVQKMVTRAITTDDDRNNLKMGMSVLNDQTPLTVRLNCYDSARKNLKTVTINNVKCVRDRKTILSGKLFALPSSGLDVSVDPVWQKEPAVIQF